MLIRPRLVLCAALAALPLIAYAAAPLAPVVAAAPLHTNGAKASYPRLTRFPDAKIMAKVNALLATKEKEDRGAYTDCLKMLKDMKMKPDKDSYNEDITVRYLSVRMLSIEVVTSYYCAGAYPTNGAEAPVSVDLSTGTAIDWTTQFKPGFLNVESKADVPPPGMLTKIYRARYSKAKDDADCRREITDQDPFSSPPIVWLDAKGGIVFQPDLPHVIAACALTLTLTPAQIAPYLKNAALTADLKATVHK